jgi:alkylation response protein AidB-like acyl-CoA dehydrogenase
MNFDLTEDQSLIKDMIKDFADNEIKPAAKSYEKRHEFPRKLIDKLADLGILGMSVPPEYGGNKTDYISLMLCIEEISRAMPSLAVIVSVHCSLFCGTILQFGNEALKEKYLPAAAAGKLLGAFSLTEPGAGSDALNLTTKAVRDGSDFVLNGTKAWVSTGKDAGSVIVFARTESDSPRPQIDAFLIEQNTPGLKVSKVEEKMGMHASPTVELRLEDCRVPSEQRIGKEGEGAKIALSGLDCSRIGIAAQAVGLSQRALEEALQYSQQREAFGGTIANFQAIQFKLADIATQLEAARLLTYRAADSCERGLPFSKQAAMAKLFASEAANRIVYEALQIHGGYGYSQEFPIEQLYRDARVLSIYEGTSEIQRIVIARNLLKD